MYENLTLKQVQDDIITRISTSIDTSEGSFARDMVSAVSYKIWQTFKYLDKIVPIAFVDKTSGIYIDRRCDEYGITRKAGAKASAVLTVQGTNGTVIPAEKVFLNSYGLQFISDAAATISGGSATVNVTAYEIGDKYNVGAGTITLQLVELNGITSVTNESAASKGMDTETDEALVSRLHDFLRTTATSGNAAQYKEWALSVNGVGKARVTPLWNGNGTVKILIVGSDNGPVESSVVTACAEYIEANCPIGATVTVESAVGLPIDVTASVSIDGTTTKEAVETALKDALGEYLKSIAFEKYTLLYNKIAYMLLGISGVIDFSSLKVNTGTDNITIADNQVPVLGGVNIS